jgi:hypothetical protein
MNGSILGKNGMMNLFFLIDCGILDHRLDWSFREDVSFLS